MTLLGTGGTIASRLDYRTGAVIPAFTPGELYGAVPELADICNLTTKKLFGVFSENMAREQYIALAEAIGDEIEAGADGIVDRPRHRHHGPHRRDPHASWCRTARCRSCWSAASAPATGPPSDAALQPDPRRAHRRPRATSPRCRSACSARPRTSYGLLHRGTRCRKMHSSYRSHLPHHRRHPAGDGQRRTRPAYLTPTTSCGATVRARCSIDAVYDDRATILYYYPGMKPDLVDALVEKGYRGIVIAGTGLGHVNKPLYPALKRADRGGRARRHDRADAVGLRPDVRLRHRPRPAGPRRRPARQHAAGDGADEALLGARPHRRPRRGDAR